MRKKIVYEIMKNLFVFCCIALLVIVALLPIYQSSYNNARALMEKERRSQVTKGFAQIVNTLDGINAQMFVLRNSPTISKIAALKDKDQKKYINMYYYNRQDSRYLLDGSLLDLLIQFRENNVLLMHNRSVQDKRTAYGTIFGYKELDYPQWQSESLKNHLFWPAQLFYVADGKTEECITFNWYNAAVPYKTVMLSALVRTEYLKNSLGFSSEDGEFVYFTQRDGSLLLSDGYPLNTPLPQPLENTVSLEGETYTLISLSNDTLGLNAVVGVPASIYVKMASPVLRTLFFYILVAMVAVIIVALIHGYFHCKSIRPLLVYLDNNAITGNKNNIFKQVGTLIQYMDVKGEELRRDYRRALSQCRTLAFDHALSGLPLDEEEISFLGDIDVLAAPYIIIALGFSFEEEHPDASSSGAVIKLLLRTQWPSGYLHTVSTDQWLCVLPFSENIYDKLTQMASQLTKELNTPIAIGMSKKCDGINCLCQGGKQATQALMVAFTENISVVQTTYKKDHHVFAPFAQYKMLVEQLQSGNIVKVNALLAFFKEHMVSDLLSYQQKQNMLLNLEVAICAADNTENTMKVEFSKSDLSIHSRIKRIEKMALRHCEQMEQHRQNKSDQRIEEILAYINNHYSDSSLCLTKIADQFNFSESRISQYIKENTGHNYSALVEKKRMEEAMNLLINTDLSIEKISYQVGYEHKNTFYKSFKRFYGAPPNKYRSK